ncbi:tyrosine-type recombinase/integrase [Pelotomaculum propionicicum]|uniref:Tyrosine recombinase XerC n=1 Tax=Pelotomaculum propionicicum TaxID=258475 RepID=A0A4Y7RIW6_9FIRM|nr:tyrosine-type recombinase/integrase [Pelotomaculum propionicicum]NLI11914.1 tyrosine-type recombinase/integrase [Peptococcaceae bacterium]TEB08751.1 Tyrosine recombinase XerC [Pelotomaculum propionicicum]
MDTEKNIRKMIEQVLDELKSQGYSKNCIQRYVASYRGLLAYADGHGISEYSEAVGLDYMFDQFGYKLEGFFGNLPQPVSNTLHHLLVLWHYQHYSTVEFITRGQKKAFQCPENYQKEYEAFHKAPYGAFKMSNGMQHILWKYMRFAGLEIPRNEHCGLHSLRSTLARTMLESGGPLPVISEVLGHESVQSTSVYLKNQYGSTSEMPYRSGGGVSEWLKNTPGRAASDTI